MQSNTSEKGMKNNKFWNSLKQSPILGAIVALILVVVVMTITGGGTFMSSSNMINIVRQSAVLSIVAIGQTFVIISGGIDLSVAPLVSLSSIVVSFNIVNNEMSWGLAIILAVAVCAALGLFNGVLITFVKIPPIIATLATTMAFQGLCLLYSQGYGVNLPSGNAMTAILGRGTVGGFPIAGIFMIAMYVLFYFILRYTSLGRITYGLGGNAEAVHLSGINTSKYRMTIYGLSGMMSGIAGIMLAARLNSGHPYNGEGLDMNSIAAVVLGGATVSGGTGMLWGTLLGVFILTMIENGLNMINMNPYLQMMVKGLIIIGAIGLGSLRERKK